MNILNKLLPCLAVVTLIYGAMGQVSEAGQYEVSFSLRVDYETVNSAGYSGFHERTKPEFVNIELKTPTYDNDHTDIIINSPPETDVIGTYEKIVTFEGKKCHVKVSVTHSLVGKGDDVYISQWWEGIPLSETGVVIGGELPINAIYLDGPYLDSGDGEKVRSVIHLNDITLL